jgi:transposase
LEIPRTIPNRTDQINRRQAKGPRGGRPADFNADLDKKRHTVKRGSVRLKQWRGIASRYDKHAFISLATIVRNHHIRT